MVINGASATRTVYLSNASTSLTTIGSVGISNVNPVNALCVGNAFSVDTNGNIFSSSLQFRVVQLQSNTSISIGNQSGSNQSANAVAIGNLAGQTGQNINGVAIGSLAGRSGQSQNSIAIGTQAGNTSQGQNSIAIGTLAGITGQTQSCIAIGNGAAISGQSGNCIAIGSQAANNSQGANSIAIGNRAGNSGQNANCIAIGSLASLSQQPTNSIILNSGLVSTNVLQSGSFYVNPIRQVNPSRFTSFLSYDASNSEVYWTNTVTQTAQFSNLIVASPASSNTAFSFVVGSSNLTVGANGFIGVNAAPDTCQMIIQGSTAANPVLRVQGASGQTANLQSWSDVNGNVVASVSNIGGVTAPTLSRSPPAIITNGYVVQPTDTWLLANAASSNCVITLPSPSLWVGRELTIRRLQTGASYPFSYHVVSSLNNVMRMEYGVTPAIPQPVILDTNINNPPPNAAAPSSYWSTLVSDGTYWWQMAGV